MELTFDPNDRGQVGIGTLIVFIAMVLVAAIAAGVLINTAGFLQTQAEDTGTESTEQVANNLNVITTVGDVASSGTTVDTIRLGVQPAAGSDDLNLEEVSIQFVSDESFSNLVHVQESDVDGAGTVFNTEAVTAEDGTDNVMTDNSDRYEVVVPLEDEYPFLVDAELSGGDGDLAIDEDNDAVVLESDDAADRPAKLDLVVENQTSIATAENVSKAFAVDQSDVYEVEIPGDGTAGNVSGEELVYNNNDAFNLDSNVDDTDFETSIGNAGSIDDGDDVKRFVVYVDEIDVESLSGFGNADGEGDFTQEYHNNLDNSDLSELQQGEEAELTFTTETGAQTVAILQMPDSLAGEDEGDTVDL